MEASASTHQNFHEKHSSSYSSSYKPENKVSTSQSHCKNPYNGDYIDYHSDDSPITFSKVSDSPDSIPLTSDSLAPQVVKHYSSTKQPAQKYNKKQFSYSLKNNYHHLNIFFFLKRYFSILFGVFFLLLNTSITGAAFLQGLGLLFVKTSLWSVEASQCPSQLLTERLFHQYVHKLQSQVDNLYQQKQQQQRKQPPQQEQQHQQVFSIDDDYVDLKPSPTNKQEPLSDYSSKKTTTGKSSKIAKNEKKQFEQSLTYKKRKSSVLEFQVETEASEDDAFLVTVDDGTLHKVSPEGSIKWSLLIAATRKTDEETKTKKKSTQTTENTFDFNTKKQQQKQFYGSDSTFEVSRELSKTRRLVAAPDGYIFYYAEDAGFFPLQAHVKDIVFHSPFSTPLFPSIFFLGKKEAVVELIDFKTGERLIERGKSNSTVLNLGQTRWIVQAIDSQSLSEIWKIEWIEITPIISLGGDSTVSVHSAERESKLSGAVCEFHSKTLDNPLYSDRAGENFNSNNVCGVQKDMIAAKNKAVSPEFENTSNNISKKPVMNKYSLKLYKKDLLITRYRDKETDPSTNMSFRFHFPGTITAIHPLKDGLHGEKLLDMNLMQFYKYSNVLQAQETRPSTPTSETSANNESQNDVTSLIDDSTTVESEWLTMERIIKPKVSMAVSLHVRSQAANIVLNPCWQIATYDDTLEYCAVSCEGNGHSESGTKPADQLTCPWTILTMNLLQLHRMMLVHNESLPPLILLANQDTPRLLVDTYVIRTSEELFELKRKEADKFALKEFNEHEEKPSPDRFSYVGTTFVIITVFSWIFLLSTLFGLYYSIFPKRFISLLRQTLPHLFLQPSGSLRSSPFKKLLSRRQVPRAGLKRKPNFDEYLEKERFFNNRHLINRRFLSKDLVVYNTSSSLERSIISSASKRSINIANANQLMGYYREQQQHEQQVSYFKSMFILNQYSLDDKKKSISNSGGVIRSLSGGLLINPSPLLKTHPKNIAFSEHVSERFLKRYSYDDLPTKTSIGVENSRYLQYGGVSGLNMFSRKPQILRNETKHLRKRSTVQLKYARKLRLLQHQKQRKQSLGNLVNFWDNEPMLSSNTNKGAFQQEASLNSNQNKNTVSIEQQSVPNSLINTSSYKVLSSETSNKNDDENRLFRNFENNVYTNNKCYNFIKDNSTGSTEAASTRHSNNINNNSQNNKHVNNYYKDSSNDYGKSSDSMYNFSSNVRNINSYENKSVYEEAGNKKDAVMSSPDCSFSQADRYNHENIAVSTAAATAPESVYSGVAKISTPTTNYKSYILSLETRTESVTLPPPSMVTIIGNTNSNNINNNNSVSSNNVTSNININNNNTLSNNNDTRNSYDGNNHENMTPSTSLLPIFTKSNIPKDHSLADFVENGRFFRTFKDIRLIGRGGFGCVYQVSHRFEPNCPLYAVKFITLQMRASENLSNGRYFREVSANRDLFSRQVVRYFTWWCEEPQFLPSTSSEQGNSSRLVLKQDATLGSSSDSESFSELNNRRRRRRRQQRRRKLLSSFLSSLYVHRSVLPTLLSGRSEKESSIIWENQQEQIDNKKNNVVVVAPKKRAKNAYSNKQESSGYQLGKELVVPAVFNHPNLVKTRNNELILFSNSKKTTTSGAVSFSSSRLSKISYPKLSKKYNNSSTRSRMDETTGGRRLLFKKAVTGNDGGSLNGKGARSISLYDYYFDDFCNKQAKVDDMNDVQRIKRTLNVSRSVPLKSEKNKSVEKQMEKFYQTRRKTTELTRNVSNCLLPDPSLKRGSSSIAGFSEHDEYNEDDDNFIVFRNSRNDSSRVLENSSGESFEYVNNSLENDLEKKKALSAKKREQEQSFPITLLIQMELIGGMTLRQWLDRPQRSTRVQDLLKSFFDNRQKQIPTEISLFRQLIKGLRDIHKNGIVHRDIKPENIFVNENPLWLKIGDFGLVRFIEATSITNNDIYNSGPASGNRKSRMMTSHVDSVVSVKGLVIGTPCYTAPEGGALCTEKADIYSAALIFLELLCPRFKTEMERLTILENFRTHQIVPKHIEIELRRWGALIKRMGAINPKQRPSAEAIYQNLKIRLNFAFYEGNSSSSSSLSNSMSPANCSNEQPQYLLHLSEKVFDNFNQNV